MDFSKTGTGKSDEIPRSHVGSLLHCIALMFDCCSAPEPTAIAYYSYDLVQDDFLHSMKSD